MALVYEQSWTNPTSTARIYIDTSRNKEKIVVKATVVCTLTYNDGFINYDGEINFNMWHGNTRASANIKGYSDRWSAGTPRTRTRTCSMEFTDTGNKFDIGFNMTIPDDRPAGAAFRIGDRVAPNISAPTYNAPTTPTWISIQPNPVDINNSPLITWGGSKIGSLGTLFYDVEVRSSKPDGTWTDYLRIASAQQRASYQEIPLNQMNVYGQRPFVGVKYEYIVRASDGAYSTSNWIHVVMNVSFIGASRPTSYALSQNTIKTDGEVKISWSGATGGSGTISNYQVDYRIYNHKTSKWTNWENVYSGSSTSYLFKMMEHYKSATNGDLLQFRIRTRNSWGQWSTYLQTSSVNIKSNQIWIKINGSWKEAETYLKINGSWKEATPYIKINGSWKETS